ncbi:MAG TPA: glycogen synthase GlgA [Oxalicibacterium sp.]|uniref:glycogen synthase GlgA n=1 Tax=Oxalicibacterium sp. TaxID=2766525 RepID=UPI002C65215F|nr:glycogen synthase GlgA [Oxalicibacterium sp.]HWU96992.1 glycogen synthase GlgA [Oxalicibacterium sp.]
MMPQPRVLLVTSEAIPLVKTGGLADVIGALASSLSTLDVDVTILLPGYPTAVEKTSGLKKIADLVGLPGGDAELFLGKMPDTGVKVLVLCSPLFDKRTVNPYVDHTGHELDDNAIAFASLAHAAVRVCAGKANYPVPHVVQANDWHAALIPALLKLEKITDVGTALTIHNLAFQGNYPTDIAPQIGIPAEMIDENGMEFWGKMSYLKAGIAYSDSISTVSNTYAKEILTERFGYGFEGILNRRKSVLQAIPNGVDLDVWNPSTDPLIKRNFSDANMSGKAACKRDLQKLFNLPIQQFTPLMAIGSRITHQKMADLILDAMPRILQDHPHLQIAILGCGDPQYENQFKQLAAEHPDRIGVFIGYDEHRAHALHAGADILLHPTRFEPFGLTPIYSMLYGTIPVASRVGGLCDTIVDAGRELLPADDATGILFDGEETDDLVDAIAHALRLYARPAAWQTMQRRAMQGDYSWTNPALAYIQMYSRIAPPTGRQLFLDLLKPKASKPSVNPNHYKLTA